MEKRICARAAALLKLGRGPGKRNKGTEVVCGDAEEDEGLEVVVPAKHPLQD